MNRFPYRFLYGFWVVSLGVLTALTFVRTHPPHAAPPVAEVPEYANEVVPDLLAQVVDYVAWIEGVQRAEMEEAARVAAARRPTSVGVAAGGDCALTGWAVPDRILWRESRCSLDAYNATGCGGRGCIGAAQLDLGHFASPSPWGGVGSCYGLDPYSVADQQQCVAILSNDGTNLAPWGG